MQVESGNVSALSQAPMRICKSWLTIYLAMVVAFWIPIEEWIIAANLDGADGAAMWLLLIAA